MGTSALQTFDALPESAVRRNTLLLGLDYVAVEATVGLFVSAQVVGSLVGGAVLGPLFDRRGSAAVVQVTTAMWPC